jgi:hypothetical protein
MNDDMLCIQNPKTKEIIMIDGIVGWNAIQNIDIYIDYKNKEVRMKEPVKTIVNVTNMFIAGRAILKLTAIDNKPIYFGIDTGASQSSISEKASVGIPSQNIVKKLITAVSVGGTKQLEISYIKEQALFMMDGYKLSFENMRVEADLTKWAVFFELDGVVGSDLVRNTCLHIDCCNGLVEIGD